MNKRLLFEYQLVSTLDAITSTRHLLADVLSCVIKDGQTQQYILLCLSEALTNLVQHNSSPSIVVRFYQHSEQWVLEMVDHGHYWDPMSEIANTELTSINGEEHGRGIPLLRELSDQGVYQSDNEQCHTLCLIWKRTKNDKKPTVLLVEDDDTQYRLYKAYLADEFVVHRAINGVQALDMVKTTQISAIISDIMMPEMDGMALREKLLDNQRVLVIPFIFFTSSEHISLREQSVHLGVDDYLLKPVSKETLIFSINRVIQRNDQIYTKLTDRIEAKITASLAPRLPAYIHQWQVALATRNTGIGGGDIVQHTVHKQDATIILADIMGHDDTAKFFSYAYTGYLHGLLHGLEQSVSPNVILEKLSKYALHDKLFSCITLTACVTQLKKNGVLTFSCAAHPPPIHITQQGVNALDVSGVLPGLVDNASYKQLSIQLNARERIALYTDGLFEPDANTDIQQLIEAEIYQLLMETLDLDIDAAIQIIMSRFDELSPNYSDDVSLILLEYC